MGDEDDVLTEQVEHYRRRAPIYDTWWQRTGRYDVSPEEKRDWFNEIDQVEAELDRFGAHGAVLELAGGTGWWTERLARTATSLTVVDSAPEVLALNRQRVHRSDVVYVEADVFRWEPEEPKSFDVVLFSFWLSHVPRQRFEAFWSLVDRCLTPGGRAFLIDNRRTTTGGGDPYVVEYQEDLHIRRLDDGSEHRVVKVYFEPDELARKLRRIGWEAEIMTTRRFVYGQAHRLP